jgi:hypothetical protein
VTARKFTTYHAALTCAFEEEVSGAAYFAALADRNSGPARAALLLMAQIEGEMVRDLTPLVQRQNITAKPLANLAAQGRADASTEADWPEFTRKMAEDYADYVTEFQTAFNLAPTEDRPVLQRLIDHELALIAFAKAYRAGNPNAFTPLRAFLAMTG